MLHPASKRLEKILLFGAHGTGKTNAVYSILERLRSTGWEGNWWHIDTDGTAPVYGFEEQGAIVFDLLEDQSWQAFPDAVKKAHEGVDRATKQDWLSIDRASIAWDRVIGDYIQHTLGKSMSEFFSRRIDEAFKEVNWNAVNTAYMEYMGLVNRWPGHVILTASEEAVKRTDPSNPKAWVDSPQVQRDFRAGVKPAGQKQLASQMFSVLWMQEPRSGEFTITTVKDVRREKVVAAEVSDFSISYLMKVGGWEQ